MLVITLILLSVITFTAITFVILARREKGAVATSTDQTISKLAAETALERVQAEILANMMATTNKFAYDLIVSTNYINPHGFIPNDLSLTNVNYDYKDDGTANFSAADWEVLIANLFHDPRPPVFVYSDRRQTNTPDFRFYLDLNQNGVFETNGPVGLLQNGISLGITNRMLGDPEWIGILERPDEPHSASNRFTARYAYLVEPSGKTIDVNHANNQALNSFGDQRDYRRNMGVGTWEINLGAFLVDLNTNFNANPALNRGWPGPQAQSGTDYRYDPLSRVGVKVSGLAFEHANALLAYRYDTRFTSLRRLQQLFTPLGVNAFTTDLIDGFGSGPFLTNLWPDVIDPDVGREGQWWPGDESPQAFFAPSDFLDPRKLRVAPLGAGLDFRRTLLNAGADTNTTYNQYTFYRMISQLGTDGGTERDDKININYDNKVQRNFFGVASATNFYQWQPVDFFTQAANELLREYNTPHFRRVFGNDFVNNTDNNFAGAIPVMTNGVFIYTPSVHRLLQLAANVYDSTTNQTPDYPYLPSVFRPILAAGTQLPPEVATNVPPDVLKDSLFIVNWEPITTDWAQQVTLSVKDPFVPAQRALVDLNDNFYGVPWIIGAKKGFPNFNELAVENVFELSRKLELGKRNLNEAPYYTNQMFLVAISSSLGVEAWNSYLTDYPYPVTVYATNELDVYVSVTNLPSGLGTSIPLRTTVARSFTVPGWLGTRSQSDPAQKSFSAVISTNLSIITNSIFRASGLLELVPSRLSYLAADRNLFPAPDIRLSYTNKLRFIMVDERSGGRRIIDYVQLRAGGETNLTAELDRMSGSDRLGRNPALGGFRNIWDNTRARANDITSPTRGVLVQIGESMNPFNGNSTVWRDAGRFGSFRSGSVRDEINGFIAYMAGWDRSNLVVEVPYTPTARFRLKQRWEANDPLVHYTDGDLAVSEDDTVDWLPMSVNDIQSLKTIGKLNERYQPWGGNPSSGASSGNEGRRRYNPMFKDPGVKSSDNWTFPTNKFPNVGWLGRVHRGTPWQTVYLKASSIQDNRRFLRDWREWTGNWNRRDARLTQPEQDRRLFDVFTAALSESATAGQMSVNQDGLAAWSAVLSGVITLSNATPDEVLAGNPFASPTNTPVLIEPAGLNATNSPLALIWRGINRTRANTNDFPKRQFESLGDVLATPELTDLSPFLNLSDIQKQAGITDPMYERIPQQILGLLRGNEQPRFTVYAYGQSLKPADRSLVLSGPNIGLCTNYQITAEAALRALVQVRGAPDNPRVIIESFSYLPPE